MIRIISILHDYLDQIIVIVRQIYWFVGCEVSEVIKGKSSTLII